MGTTTFLAVTLPFLDYTIPRNKWELQLPGREATITENYTIPRNKWELQQFTICEFLQTDYTIPRNKWELQP